MGSRSMYQEVSAQARCVPRGTALPVDEYPDDLQYYSNILEAYGYQVRACCSYQEGVHCLDDEVFDFVIVGHGTPKFEGSCVLKRAAEVNRSLPVLVVARCLDLGCYVEAMQLGAVDYLVEPPTVWEIGRVLETHAPIRSTAAEMSGAVR